MRKEGKAALVPVSEAQRQAIREARERLGLTQAAVDKMAKLKKTYVWYVESGETKSTDPARLTRLLQTLQKQAERAQAPARVKAGLSRALKDVEKRIQGKARQ